MPTLLDFIFDHIFAFTGVFIALYFALCAIYQLCFSPLCDIPGPWYAAISDFWLITHVLRLQQCRTINTLFALYGPVVRVGPNKVVFNDLFTARNVYSILKFDKSKYYKSLLTNDNDHAMTTLSHASHVFRKKGYAPHYTPTSLAQFQPEIVQSALELVNILDGIVKGNAINCLSFFRHLMVDIASVSSFGYRVGALNKWAIDAEDPLVTAIGDFPKRGILRSAVPVWAWKLVCSIPNRRWRQLCDSDKIMAEFVSARVYETRLQMVSGASEQSDRVALVQRLLRYYSGQSTDTASDRDVISEHMGHLVGACDTTSTTLSYLFWELSRRPNIAKNLQAELDAAIPDCKTFPDISVLQDLPYLTAFIKEGLRLYGAVPSLLERVVPCSSEKTTIPEAFDLMGFALPPGTIVGTQAWSMHRDPSVFPSPETFSPERWLETGGDDKGKLEAMNRHMMPFGKGSRVCGGQNLAQMVLRIATAAIARNFELLAPPETTEKSMEMRDSFVVFPASMACRLIFNARKNR
ncbi:cytochrome P450 [Multifurca ochricompacta]|uniref:Cytochrome P450 n=1 Tax=Multifurca ochricompacta TaxID=376703 RepID=A0AAD4QSM4_9AGAM|nr:cytochrome P450 [Multifurca ochricompacta]